MRSLRAAAIGVIVTPSAADAECSAQVANLQAALGAEAVADQHDNDAASKFKNYTLREY